jgi:lipoprotein-anchoring transpeptidase ErfK/SrfK
MSRARALTILLATAVVVGGLGAAGAAATLPGQVGEQQLAGLTHDTPVYAAPQPDSTRLTVLRATRPITGEQTVLPVIGQANGSDGLRWLRVLLPGRPDGHSGWIRQPATIESFTSWRIKVNLATRSLTVLYRGRVVRHFSAVVGKPTTPTPVGRFFVEENVQLAAQLPGAPYALALSARSNALREYDGGPGQTAIHGTNNLAGAPGTAVSHGCIRVSTPDITWLAARIGPGVPVTIVG